MSISNIPKVAANLDLEAAGSEGGGSHLYWGMCSAALYVQLSGMALCGHIFYWIPWYMDQLSKYLCGKNNMEYFWTV